MRIFCIFYCILLLASCGVKRESRQVSVMMQADSLRIRHTDSIRFSQRLYHTAGQRLVWEEVILSVPDSLSRQHVQRLTRVRMSNEAHTRVTDSTTVVGHRDVDRLHTSATATGEEKRSESNHSPGNRWLLILLAAAAGWLAARK